MIDISPYMQRLEWLKEWVALLVDHDVVGLGRSYWRFGCVIISTPRLDERGRFIGYYKRDIRSFDEYYNYKQSLSKTNQQ